MTEVEVPRIDSIINTETATTDDPFSPSSEKETKKGGEAPSDDDVLANTSSASNLNASTVSNKRDFFSAKGMLQKGMAVINTLPSERRRTSLIAKPIQPVTFITGTNETTENIRSEFTVSSIKERDEQINKRHALYFQSVYLVMLPPMDPMTKQLRMDTYPYGTTVTKMVGAVLPKEPAYLITKITQPILDFLKSKEATQMLVSYFWLTVLRIRRAASDKGRAERQKASENKSRFPAVVTGSPNNKTASSLEEELGSPKKTEKSSNNSNAADSPPRVDEDDPEKNPQLLFEQQSDVDRQRDEELAKNLYHNLACNFGQAYTNVNAPAQGFEMEPKDDIFSLFPILATHITYYTMTHIFPNDAENNMFNKNFRRELYRQIYYWCTGIQPQRVVSGNWPRAEKIKRLASTMPTNSPHAEKGGGSVVAFLPTADSFTTTKQKSQLKRHSSSSSIMNKSKSNLAMLIQIKKACGVDFSREQRMEEIIDSGADRSKILSFTKKGGNNNKKISSSNLKKQKSFNIQTMDVVELQKNAGINSPSLAGNKKMLENSFAKALGKPKKKAGPTEQVATLHAGNCRWYEEGKVIGHLCQERRIEFGTDTSNLRRTDTSHMVHPSDGTLVLPQLTPLTRSRKGATVMGSGEDSSKSHEADEGGGEQLHLASDWLSAGPIPGGIHVKSRAALMVENILKSGEGVQSANKQLEAATLEYARCQSLPQHSPLMEYYMKKVLAIDLQFAGFYRRKQEKPVTFTVLSEHDVNAVRLRFSAHTARVVQDGKDAITAIESSKTAMMIEQSHARAEVAKSAREHDLQTNYAKKLLQLAYHPLNEARYVGTKECESLLTEALKESGGTLAEIVEKYNIALDKFKAVLLDMTSKDREALSKLAMKCKVRIMAISRRAPHIFQSKEHYLDVEAKQELENLHVKLQHEEAIRKKKQEKKLLEMEEEKKKNKKSLQKAVDRQVVQLQKAVDSAKKDLSNLQVSSLLRSSNGLGSQAEGGETSSKGLPTPRSHGLTPKSGALSEEQSNVSSPISSSTTMKKEKRKKARKSSSIGDQSIISPNVANVGDFTLSGHPLLTPEEAKALANAPFREIQLKLREKKHQLELLEALSHRVDSFITNAFTPFKPQVGVCFHRILLVLFRLRQCIRMSQPQCLETWHPGYYVMRHDDWARRMRKDPC